MTTTVLLIDDTSGDALIVQELLNETRPREYELIHVVRIGQAIEILKKPNNIDIIISDIALPDSQGYQSFQKLKAVAANLPVIFFTGTHDESLAVSALQKGAQDYLLKGQFEGETLRRSIKYAIERKRFQKEAESARARTRKLRQNAAMLEREREQLLMLNNAKEEFLSLASHQLRTPATGVKQYINMLLQGFAGDLPGQQRQILEQANQSNERQLKIVQDLLQTAHLDAGRIDLDLSKVDMVKLLKEIIDEQQSQFDARKQTIEFKATSPMIYCEVDEKNLRMAFENIIDNASKYSQSGKSIKVKVSDTATSVKISIEDHGVGIHKQDVDKVFDKFARVTNPLSDDVGGSGLGLYWAKSMFDLHKGKVKVVSELGAGTKFNITLPRKNSAK